MEHYDDSTAAWQWASQYVRPDDPEEARQVVVMMLVVGSRLFNLHGKYDEAEAACRRATEIEPVHEESWRVLAEAILCQDDNARLPEAEECARRAVELAPENPSAHHILSDVLACCGNWTEALDRLAHALHLGGDSFQEKEWPGLTESLIPMVAAGHGSRVKRMMEEAGLVEPMEPLWHAIRAELGEELEPLPAEIMEAVTDLRQEFSDCTPDCCINSYVLVRETPLYKGYFAHWPVRLRFTPSEDKLHRRDTRFALLLQHELPLSIAFYATVAYTLNTQIISAGLEAHGLA